MKITKNYPPKFSKNNLYASSKRILLMGTLAALISACTTVGPDYTGPDPIDTGNGWINQAEHTDINLSQWWDNLGDPELKRLIEQALKNNLDVKQAQANIAEARALNNKARSAYSPNLGANASVTRRAQSYNGSLPVRSMPNLDRYQTIYEPGFDSSWEIDLFGGVQRSVESASAQLQATEFNAKDIQISVAAEVARTYFYLRGAQKDLAAQENTITSLNKTTELTKKQYAIGELARAEMVQAESRLAIAKAKIPTIKSQIRASSMGLSVLSGQLPEAELELEQASPKNINLQPTPVGKRADILRRRPDVLAAERKLAARTADIGVATAELFPKLSINANGGFQSLSTGNLIDSSSQIFTLMPLISWRIFEGGRIRAEINASEARQEQAALAYEKVVLEALNDAEQSLNAYQSGLLTIELEDQALAAANDSYKLMQARYQSGDVALTDLLAEQRFLLDTEKSHIKAYTDASINLISLYKALGGGWDMDTAINLSRH